MSVILPNKYNQVLDSELSFNSSVDEETCKKLSQNINMLGELAKIGSVVLIESNFSSGVPIPNPTILQLANGSEITEVTSPLRSSGVTTRSTPNLVDKYLRGASDTSTNPVGGSPSIDLSHNHTGLTLDADEFNDSPFQLLGEQGNDHQSEDPGHRHTVETEAQILNNDPAYMKIVAYMRIN